MGKEMQGRSHESGDLGKKKLQNADIPIFIGLCPAAHFTRKASVGCVDCGVCTKVSESVLRRECSHRSSQSEEVEKKP